MGNVIKLYVGINYGTKIVTLTNFQDCDRAKRSLESNAFVVIVFVCFFQIEKYWFIKIITESFSILAFGNMYFYNQFVI